MDGVREKISDQEDGNLMLFRDEAMCTTYCRTTLMSTQFDIQLDNAVVG